MRSGRNDLSPRGDGVEVRPSRFGRGVFATRAFKEGEVVEVAPVVPVTRKEGIKLRGVHVHAIHDYWFAWRPPERPDIYRAFSLGFGAMYNHSKDANIDAERDYDNLNLVFYALRDIEPGEELVHDYGYNYTRYEFCDEDAPPDTVIGEIEMEEEYTVDPEGGTVWHDLDEALDVADGQRLYVRNRPAGPWAVLDV